MKGKLTEKQQLFCTYYCLDRNAREAAAKSGYRFAAKAAAMLMRQKAIVEQINALDEKERAFSKDVTAGYYRLAFGCVSDAVGLLFDSDEEREKINGLDLFNVSEIKRQKGGALEIKFFDRLKALEHLEQTGLVGGSDAAGIYGAIEKGARAISQASDE